MKTISSVFFLDLSVKISHVKYCGESVDRYLMYCIFHMLSQCKLIYLYKYKCKNSRNYCQYLIFTVIAVYVVQIDVLSSGRLLSNTNSKKNYLSRSSRHSNNSIIDLAGLHQTLSHFLTQPSELGWLDLSFNKLKHTNPVRLFLSHMFACVLPLFLLVVFCFFPLFFLFDRSLTYCQHCLFI